MNNKNPYQYKILILDFGSQYTQLIARRVRELGVYCELYAYDVIEKNIRQFNPDGIILSGGPQSAVELKSPSIIPKCIFNLGIPLLGICYGMQIMILHLGGKVKKSKKREFGYAQVEIINQSRLVNNIADEISSSGKPLLNVWMSHNDIVTDIPENFGVIARTTNCPFTIIANEDKCWYGVQFHPEVTHTSQGLNILKRFVYDICNCQSTWIPTNIISTIIKDIVKQVNNDQVILGISGGIDSAVTAILLHRAIGDRLICIFVDNGLLRLNEAEQVMDVFGKHFGLNILHISAADRFLNALVGINDPEDKRKIIGSTFIEIFNEEASKFNVKWLAQGTIYSDIIESSRTTDSKANIIKSHHNVGGLPEIMNLSLVEPIKHFFKDEVRKIGIELGIPQDILSRHPFPGPGLGVRVLGEVRKDYCNLLRFADSIFIEELHKADLYNKLSQAFAVFLPIRSIGIMGDNRKYDWVISLRAIRTVDFMTANWAHLPYTFLERVSNRIINEVQGISRVVYDISGKPPATIEWE